MQVYYIFDEDENVIAIFTDEAFARDYLYHIGANEEKCKIGMISSRVFNFDEHDAKYHTLQDSSLKRKIHRDCKRFKEIDSNGVIGYCFLTDEKVNGYKTCCTMIEEKK